MMEPDLDRAAGVAVELACRAGEGALKLLGRIDRASIGFKGVRDLVTEADLNAERLLVEGIRQAFPQHAILAEEESSRAERAGDTEGVVTREAVLSHPACWIIDPLDGTTNFAHSHPFFAVSMALVSNGSPVLGVVFAPKLDELFVARQGRGTTLNGAPVHVSQSTALKDAIFATGFPYRRDELPDLENNVEHFNRFIREVRGFRRCGAAALDLAYIACGRYDVYFEAQLEAWDVAAGALLVREAGGTVTDQRGGEDWLFGRNVVATNGALHSTALERLHPDWRR